MSAVGVKYSVVIATYNRAGELHDTLASLARLRADGPWEVIVVDNNSSDDTRQVVEAASHDFPVALRYVHETRQGRSPALNAGIAAARGEIIVTTDDDVRVPPGWLNAAARGLEALKADYVGGRVLPIWGGPPPSWLSAEGGRHWAVVALLDYGDKPKEFGARVPLGVNMAFRRSALERAGLLDPDTGRKAGTLLGQEIREWCIRARRVGVRGFYVPDMVVEHIVPAERLTKAYFRRWFYWRGISRALLHQRFGLDMEYPEKPLADAAKARYIAGLPPYMYVRALKTAKNWVVAMLSGRTVQAFEQETWFWFFAGVARQRWSNWRSRSTSHGKLQEVPLHAAASRDRVG